MADRNTHETHGDDEEGFEHVHHETDLDDEDGSEDRTGKSSRSRPNEDAFSSSSESTRGGDDEEDEDEDDDDDQAGNEKEDKNQNNVDNNNDEKPGSQVQSEWDKALQSGKPSKGRASDFFSAPSQSFDNESDFESSNDAAAESVMPVVRVAVVTERNAPGKPPPPPSRTSTSMSASVSANPRANTNNSTTPNPPMMRPHPEDDSLSSGVLPDVLMTMRQKIESLTLFDSDMMKIAAEQLDDPNMQESRESLKRSSQQSISAAVLVSLAHKRYERRRLAAMEIEKVVRSLVQQNEIERVRAILLLLSDDYVRSTSEDARKGGVVALAACAIGLKKARNNDHPSVLECRDLILASVVHACQDHSQRVRYYSTESLFNVVKVIPTMAVQHFFILFEILRSLYADVDADVRSGAELLDKKLKEIIVSAINNGSFTAEACVPVFARFVYIHNKATKRLTLTWLQELNERLVNSPILEFLHLFLGGIFDMVADPTLAIRESAILFLHSVLPKLLVIDTTSPAGKSESAAIDEGGTKVNFDKILQSLVTTIEHPDPFVRKVAMYWMSRIVKAHMSDLTASDAAPSKQFMEGEKKDREQLCDAAISVRHSVPHLLPGLLLSIGDDFQPKGTNRDSFLPDVTTRSLAEQTNVILQEAVRREGDSYVQHLDGFIVALREELDSPGGFAARYPPAVEHTPYRMDVKQDGTGIESPGWFSSSGDTKSRSEDSMVMSRLCALDWVVVLYESVVPVLLKADYAKEFVFAIIYQLVHNPPETIVYKSLEVLAKITVPVEGESSGPSSASLSAVAPSSLPWLGDGNHGEDAANGVVSESNISFSLDILDASRRRMMSRNREVFSALIQLHSFNEALLVDLSKVITYMCKLQPPEFVFVSFAVELNRFLANREVKGLSRSKITADLKFVSSFVQNMNHVLLNKNEAKELRNVLKDCVRSQANSHRGRQRLRLFQILLNSFAHNLAASISLCFWAGAYRTTDLFLNRIDTLDINLMFLVEVDRFIESLERPLFRHLHVRMLEQDKDPSAEGSGAMLFKALKSLLMILPQSACYKVLRDRLSSVSRFRQSTISKKLYLPTADPESGSSEEGVFLTRVLNVRRLHCDSVWEEIRVESLELPVEQRDEDTAADNTSRREWLGYASVDEEVGAKKKLLNENGGVRIEEIKEGYQDLSTMPQDAASFVEIDPATVSAPSDGPTGGDPSTDSSNTWKTFWENANQ